MAGGVVQLNGSLYRFSGPLNGFGFLNTTFSKGAINFSMQAGISPDNTKIVATLTDTNSTILGTALIPEGKPPELAGVYTVLFPPDNTQLNSPQGNGFASLTVSRVGSARLIGYLADGTQFAASSVLTANSAIPIYVSLNKGKGYLAGDLFLQTNASQVIGGTLVWSNVLFNASLDTQGSAFHLPSRSTPILNLTNENLNGQFIALGSDFTNEVQDIITVQPSGTVIPATHTDHLVVDIDKSNGMFQGSFVPSSKSAAVRFRGILLQQQGFGAGFFIHNGITGQVFIESN